MYVGCLTYVSVLTTVQERSIYMGLIGLVWCVTSRYRKLLLLMKTQGSRNNPRTSCGSITLLRCRNELRSSKLVERSSTVTQHGDGLVPHDYLPVPHQVILLRLST